MIHRLVGGAVGALVTFALLWLNHADSAAWATAAIVGAVVAFLWPAVIGLLGRRSRSRRRNEVDAEVERRMAQRQQQLDEIPPR